MPGNTDLLPMLHSGEVDGGVDSTALLGAQLQGGDESVVRHKMSLPFDLWAIAIPKGHEEMLRFVDNSLGEILDDGSVLTAASACA